MLKLVNCRKFELLNPDGFTVDGESAYETISVYGITGEATTVKFGSDGSLQSSRFFLLDNQNEPKAGCKIGLDGQFYDIGTIKVCRDTAGNIVAYRCIVV